MADKQKPLSCVTCSQPLPEGKEPEYFAQSSCGYTAEKEAERAAEDVTRYLRYAQTVNSAAWDMLVIADLDDLNHLLGRKEYLDRAYSLAGILTDLLDEVTRRAATLSNLIWDRLEQAESEEANDN